MTTMQREQAAPGSWNRVVMNKARAFLQLHTAGVVRVHVGAEEPAASSLVGIVRATGEIEELSFETLESGDNIYIQSETDDTETVLVVQSGASP